MNLQTFRVLDILFVIFVLFPRVVKDQLHHLQLLAAAAVLVLQLLTLRQGHPVQLRIIHETVQLSLILV